MAENGDSRSGTAPENRTVIGLTFGNSNGSVAFTADGKAEVIANEDGGMSPLSGIATCDGC